MAGNHGGWESLRTLRRHGLRPTLPVWITTRRSLYWGLNGVGCMVILHTPGEPFPVELLQGLPVYLDLGCDRAARAVRALNAKGVVLAGCRSWCPCQRQLVTPGLTCDETMG